jgi:tRNA wybutosine-synthesizing protein 4
MSYDMISPHDRFGKIMQQNITYAGYTVPGFYDFPTLESHQEKFISTQWARTKSITMLKAYRDLISMEEQKRVSKLEIFDEIEEWEMLMNHYCLTIASKGDVFADAFNDFCGIP